LTEGRDKSTEVEGPVDSPPIKGSNLQYWLTWVKL